MDQPADDATPPTTHPARPVESWTAPPALPRSGLEKIALLIAAVLLLLLVGAFVYGVVAGYFGARDAGAPALEAMFGRPYEQLPADFRAGIDARLRAVAPADWDQRTEAQRSAWASEQADQGLPRLGDATLVRLFRFALVAEEQAPVAACAALIRETSNGGVLSRATDEAIQFGLTAKQRMGRVEILIEAIEAQVHETPVPRTVFEVEGYGVVAAIKRLMTPDERTLFEAPDVGPVPSDAEVCASRRAYRAATLRLPTADLATYARWTYQPSR